MLRRLKTALLPYGSHRRFIYELLTVKLTKLAGIYPESFGSRLRRLLRKKAVANNNPLLYPSVAILSGKRKLRVTNSEGIESEITHVNGPDTIKSLNKDIILMASDDAPDNINLKACLLNHLLYPDAHLICCTGKDSQVVFSSYKRPFYSKLAGAGIFRDISSFGGLPDKTIKKSKGMNVLVLHTDY